MTDKKILIVEDEKIQALTVKAMVEGFGYKNVALASNFTEAISQAREISPDLVLMDINLSGAGDGIDAAVRIRSEMNVPIIYLTAYADRESVARIKPTEPFGYLIKPVNENELRVSIEMALYKADIDQRLAQSENKFRSIVEQSVDGIFLYDGHGAILEWNRGMERLTQFMRDQVMGRPLWDIIYGCLPDTLKASMTLESMREAGIKIIAADESPFQGRTKDVLIQRPDGS
ncbi:MAG: response regulator, partial [Pseudomonadota bacterium]